MTEIVQMRLASGQEVVCTFSDKNAMVEDSFMVHSVLEMIPLSEPTDLSEVESYILRPFITYADDLNVEVSINPVTVVCVTYPSEAIRSQYLVSVKEIQYKLGHDVELDPDEEGHEDEDIDHHGEKLPHKSNVISFTGRQLLKENDDS